MSFYIKTLSTVVPCLRLCEGPSYSLVAGPDAQKTTKQCSSILKSFSIIYRCSLNRKSKLIRTTAGYLVSVFIIHNHFILCVGVSHCDLCQGPWSLQRKSVLYSQIVHFSRADVWTIKHVITDCPLLSLCGVAAGSRRSWVQRKLVK